ncbi:AraC family transcriptional regulator [uncultured Desulfobacter sp.]|uniref:helix-turn-helix transcriptional regulator n=1 Tax=uncultured Desulfobacter sp. TaxID=240139 RepID=UPI002AA7C758|nr:AraC family transcriptional regulator [uncultured Desulfobacter sp.]
MKEKALKNRFARPGKTGSAWSFLRAFEQFCSGGFKHVILPSGIELVFVDVPTGKSAGQHFDIGAAPVEFSFYLSGYGHGDMTFCAGRTERINVSPGSAMISFNPGCRCRACLKPVQHFRALNIYISPAALALALQSDIDQVPACLFRVLNHQDRTPFNLACDISPAARMILDQIYNCHYQGAFYNIYLESKSMELILRLLWETAEYREPKISDRFIPDHDKACISRARDILIKAVDTPPSLKTLARKAGINDTKLKRGFRQMFGTTVFGYLRRYRMEQAEKILSRGTMNVDETAYTLGFHDTAHFIRQFRQHYGTTPGTYLKQVHAPGEEQDCIRFKTCTGRSGPR